MKAVQISQYSDAGVLTVTTDVPKPSARDGVVLLEVHVDRVFPVEKVREALPARESG
jgi:NADPH:quinone reductase-like Zn-dependent oxidoreductase